MIPQKMRCQHGPTAGIFFGASETQFGDDDLLEVIEKTKHNRVPLVWTYEYCKDYWNNHFDRRPEGEETVPCLPSARYGR